MIDPHSGVPRHRQLADVLRARIARGEYAPGDLLPSETRLSQEYEVGRGTVRRAVSLLRAEGLVDAASGRGTQVREPVEVERVAVPRGALISARPPTPDERASLAIPEGVHVLVVSVGGRVRGVYPADRVLLSTA
ncbi:GntR family transcriptional regulator [Verrucosispora sp. WMMD1129]|uniref:GntR family transcriptional regulator n=1 Tax=Verrucosispora sp. WMMD1129 TaxID=3016093 RepID=UPI00249CEE55|nr:GntR family transcriptional regulator [Verrucosispora sp. WMMD1129]WFE45279.1 GntR family transcriptional regulator [Verrucosispora sp. WMMD1129]